MNLGALLDGLEYSLVSGTQDKDVKSLVYHSDNACWGSAFFAVKGTVESGNKYIDAAAGKGAQTIIGEDFSDEVICMAEKNGLTLVAVDDVRRALAAASCNFFGRPSEKLYITGVTGTKGKTTTAFMVREIMEQAGIRTGLIGTVMSGYGDCWSESRATTPQSYDIQHMLRKMADDGCKACVMEVSSQGLMQSRVHGIMFDAAIFTNISPDHIGSREHKNFEEYLYWKSQLFKQTKVAIINKDDSMWKHIADESTAAELITFGTEGIACGPVTYMARNIRLFKDRNSMGSEYTLSGSRIRVNMPGRFNVSDSLGAVAAAAQLGIKPETAAETLEKIKVRGRTEQVETGRAFTVMVDYAHNGTALSNLLMALGEYRPEKLIVVFGCGGGRDRNRRSEMGRAAALHADFSIITSDNPRDEDPMDIIKDITREMTGAKGRYLVIPDRKKAICTALEMAEPMDMVVIAGKGHETYQITGKEKRHFDDREVILEWAASGRG